MNAFAGKRVLITGASRGIGRKLAEDFAAEGATVVLNYLNSADSADAVVAGITAAGGDAFAARADVGQSDQVAEMFSEIQSRLGGLDVLVNNAGINRDSPFLEMAEEDWDAVLATNLKGPFLCCQAAGRMMTAERRSTGRIINISAITSLVGRENGANYAASKAGLNALTRSLAAELGPQVTVNTIVLGFFDSALAREVFTADQIAAVEAVLPVGRIGKFAEISALVHYLASDAAAYMTGQAITLDGGQIIRMP